MGRGGNGGCGWWVGVRMGAHLVAAVDTDLEGALIS